MKAIEFQNVTFSYEGDGGPVLFDAGFDVSYGEVALLSGDSGSGKSTVLSLICGIIPEVTPGSLQGDILIDGESILSKKMSEICRKVGVVLQNAEAQIIYQTVEDEIAFGCENFAFPPEKIAQQIDNVCETMKLSKDWRTRTLSGGQKQRLMTACILALSRKILIVDEPLANLDAEGAELLMKTLRSLADEGCAVLVVEHRIDRVLPFTDVIWRIENHRIRRETDLCGQADQIPAQRSPAAAGGKIFELRKVCYAAEERQILHDVDLDIEKGERILLTGDNGCGKTTLMRILAGLIKPTGGTILQFMDCSEGKKIRPDRRWFQRVGVVYQNPDYQLFMPTVEQEILFGSPVEDYARFIMDRFSLTRLKNRHPQALSEGQKRRVSIAAVLANRPEVLLLDEPTVGQDYEGLRSMVQIINEIHKETGCTILTVTHDRRCMEALGGRQIRMTKGRIISG